jgi:quercetin dioxygenase-like cupin family protein
MITRRRARTAWLAALLAIGGCTARSAHIEVGSLAAGLDPFLAAHPLASAQNIRADEVERTSGASYHVVQIRGGETPHRHGTHDLTALVLRGEGAMTLGSDRLAVAAGDVVVVPRGTVHWFTNTGRGVSVALVTFTPPLDAPDTEPAIDSPPDRR